MTGDAVITYKPEAENFYNYAGVHLLVIDFVQTLLSFGSEKLLHCSNKTLVNQMRGHSFMQKPEAFICIQ